MRFKTMNNYIFTDNTGKQYKRVNKPTARRLYADGKTVILCASNIRPFNYYGVGYTDINRKRHTEYITDETSVINLFKSLVNSFEFYNCNTSECGYYTAFYVEL